MTKEAGSKKEMGNAVRDYTLNMHKRLQGIAFKKRATRAVRECKRFAAKEMHTKVGPQQLTARREKPSVFWRVFPNRVPVSNLTHFARLGCESGH